MTATMPVPPSDDAQDYWTLRDQVIDKLNPPDEDVAEIDIMCRAVDRAAAYIEAIPCTCPPGAASRELPMGDDPCGRCTVLGRCVDVREER